MGELIKENGVDCFYKVFSLQTNQLYAALRLGYYLVNTNQIWVKQRRKTLGCLLNEILLKII